MVGVPLPLQLHHHALNGIDNKVVDCLSRYYENDMSEDNHSENTYVNADIRLDPDGELLPTDLPFITCGDPFEFGHALHCDLSFFNIRHILEEAHVLIREVFCQKLKICLNTLQSDQAASQEWREVRCAMFNRFRLQCSGEMR